MQVNKKESSENFSLKRKEADVSVDIMHRGLNTNQTFASRSAKISISVVQYSIANRGSE